MVEAVAAAAEVAAATHAAEQPPPSLSPVPLASPTAGLSPSSHASRPVPSTPMLPLFGGHGRTPSPAGSSASASGDLHAATTTIQGDRYAEFASDSTGDTTSTAAALSSIKVASHASHLDAEVPEVGQDVSPMLPVFSFAISSAALYAADDAEAVRKAPRHVKMDRGS